MPRRVRKRKWRCSLSQARISFISDYQLRNERVLALPKPQTLALGVPLYALVAMVMVGLTGVCATVLLRSQGELQAAKVEYVGLQSQVAIRQAENDRLQREVTSLDADPRAIERSLREAGLIKANEVAVAIDEPSPEPDALPPLGN
ncbi:MAG: hypothetical protein CFK52_10555 [Chloracidobacterium sp. CP2_5A]|nr:MAG: hypothetical protein CFK52_10555 [Chloracidobacterium sp. CP2_5A]